MAEPAAKKAKTGDETTVETTSMAVEVEVPKELEVDAKDVKKGAGVSEQVTFYTKDTTINAMTTSFGPSGGLLKSLTEGGFQQLFAGARANVGVKAGRHMFEVKLLELVSHAEQQQRGNGSPNVFKCGFATSKSSLFLGDSEESFCFEMDGSYTMDKKKVHVGRKWSRDAVVAVVLNLDKKSPNADTVSLFSDGVRVCQPLPLPDALKGKTLYPAFTFKNVTAHVNFGPEPIMPLPFKCRMVQGMEKSEADVSPAPAEPKDGKYEILYPVGLPDEGPFDWLDLFLQKNPQYTELSERALIAWAEKSGVHTHGKVASKDDSETKTVDEDSIHQLLKSVAPMSKRDYVVMDLRASLTKEGRAKVLQRFPGESFKKVARIAVGEPTLDFQKHVKNLTLIDKQMASDREFWVKQHAEKRVKLQAKRTKQAEKLKKKAEKERKKQAEEIKKKMEAAKKAQAAKAAGEEEKKEEEPEEEKKEEPAEESSEEEVEVEEVEVAAEPPKVELTEEEKKLKFYKSSVPDVTQYVLGTSFASFTLPGKDEGFDELKYEWTKGDKADEYVKKWILDRKLTTRVEDIRPSAWFRALQSQWQKSIRDWNTNVTTYKSMLNKREADKRAKTQRKAAAAAKAEADKKKKEAEKEKAEKEGKTLEEEKEPEKPAEEPKEEEEEVHEDEEVDFDGLDIFGVENVSNLGGGMPLSLKFQAEDWAMITLRFELYALVKAFPRDCGDPDRTGIHIDHLAFYYEKYFKKALTPKSFGVESMADLVALVQDTVYMTTQSILGTVLPDDFESLGVFMKITEESRRHRTVLLESGDESARLKIQTQWQGQQSNEGGGRKWDNDKKWDNNKKWDKAGDKKSDNWGGSSSGSKWDNGNKWDNKSAGGDKAGKGGGGSNWAPQPGGGGKSGGGGSQGTWNQWGNNKSGGQSHHGRNKW